MVVNPVPVSWLYHTLSMTTALLVLSKVIFRGVMDHRVKHVPLYIANRVRTARTDVLLNILGEKCRSAWLRRFFCCHVTNIIHRLSNSQGRRQQFLSGGPKFKGSGWPRDPHHPDKVTGSARLPQVPQVGAGGRSGPRTPRLPPSLATLKLFALYICTNLRRARLILECPGSTPRRHFISVPYVTSHPGRLSLLPFMGR